MSPTFTPECLERIARTAVSDLFPFPGRREGSGFTLLFEAFIMVLARDMPVKAIASLVKEHDTRLWRILHHCVEKARGEQDCSAVTRVGVDETASQERSQLRFSCSWIWINPRCYSLPLEKDSGTLAAFKDRIMKPMAGRPTERIREVCCDYVSGLHFSGIETTFDKSTDHFLQIPCGQDISIPLLMRCASPGTKGSYLNLKRLAGSWLKE